MPSEEELRHNYLKRTERERSTSDFKTSPFKGMAHVFWNGRLQEMFLYIRQGRLSREEAKLRRDNHPDNPGGGYEY